jgi:hypothetical protein
VAQSLDLERETKARESLGNTELGNNRKDGGEEGKEEAKEATNDTSKCLQELADEGTSREVN